MHNVCEGPAQQRAVSGKRVACSHVIMLYCFGGTSVLIVVSVTMDTIQQVQSHLLAHQYESLIQKSQLRGKGKGRRKKGTARK